jgi:hypothetical protein
MTVTWARRITEAMMKEIVKDQEVIPEKNGPIFFLPKYMLAYKYVNESKHQVSKKSGTPFLEILSGT